MGRNPELRAVGKVEATQVNVKLLVGNVIENFSKSRYVFSLQHVRVRVTLRPFADKAEVADGWVVDVGQERWPVRKRIGLTEDVVTLQRFVVLDDEPKIRGGFAAKVANLLFVDDNDVGLPDVIDPVDFLVIAGDDKC